MQLGQYLNFFMESIEAAETKVAVADQRAAAIMMLAEEAEERMSKVELAFQ